MDNNRIPVFFSIFLLVGVSYYTTKRKYKKFYHLCSLSTLISAHAEFGFVLMSDKFLDFRTTHVAGILVYVALKVAHIVICWQTFIHRKKEISIFRELTNIDDLLISKLYHWIDFKKSRRVVISNALPTLIITIVFFVLYFISSFFAGSTVSWMSITSTGVIHLRYVQYIYMISLVGEKLRALKRIALLNSKRTPKIEQLFAMKCVLRKITNVQYWINDLFGWSVLFMVMTSLSQVIWVLNWFVLTLQGRINWFIILNTLLVIIPEMVSLISTCKVCQDCENVGKEISTIIARSNNRHLEFSYYLEDFSLQMMHDPVQFTARNFFSINLKTFTGMIIAVITQLFVLLQF